MPASILERLYRSDLPSFTKFAFHELSPEQNVDIGWHVDVMADALQGCLTRDTRRLILNLPPRSLKSHCASLCLPVFALGGDPSRKIIVVAGSLALARDLQRRTVALMQNRRCRALFPHLRPTVTTGEIALPQGGSILYAVVGQSLIGRGADIIVVDDPLAPHQAQDKPRRSAVNAWYDAELVSRMNDKATGIMIIVMQRLHLDDLTGHLRKRDKWSKIVLPAVALRDETWPLHRRRTVSRSKGEPLQPRREGNNRLIEILLEVDAVNFSAQYLQQPMADTNLYRTGLYYDPRPPDWQPGMECGGAFLRVPKVLDILYDVFGAGEQPPREAGEPPYSMEEWEEMTMIQQRRLLAEVQADQRQYDLQNC